MRTPGDASTPARTHQCPQSSAQSRRSSMRARQRFRPSDRIIAHPHMLSCVDQPTRIGAPARLRIRPPPHPHVCMRMRTNDLVPCPAQAHDRARERDKKDKGRKKRDEAPIVAVVGIIAVAVVAGVVVAASSALCPSRGWPVCGERCADGRADPHAEGVACHPEDGCLRASHGSSPIAWSLHTLRSSAEGVAAPQV